MKYPKFLLWCVALIVPIFILAPGGFAQGPIKLGAIFPLADITGDQGAKAMKLAVKEINQAGGLLGRQVELIIVDDEMKAEKGAAAVEKLVTVDKVDILVGGMASGVH
ncbi:MAG TPA: ABC transporter substrate-binding protein, partial [Thermodesulfobacteriota bacterium]|nr:ABC transporter substrate-binding protein [Thermodesulfobacteriota bacterium]